jgi:hypothetical protein
MKRLFTLFFALICAGAVLAQGKKVIAVYVTGNCNENIKKIMSSRIIGHIVRSKEYAAVERTADFNDALRREQNYQYSGNVDDGQAIKLGKQFGAGLVCVADASEMTNEFEHIFTTRLINIETGLIVSMSVNNERYKYNTTIEKDIVTITDNLTAELLQNVTTTAGKQKLAVYVTRSSSIFKGKSASSRLIQNFTNSGVYAAIDRTSDFQKEIGYQYTGKVNDMQLTKLGRQFGVNLICAIDVLDTDYTDVRMIDVETGIIIAIAQAKSWRMDAIDGITKELLMKQLGSLTCVEKDKQLPGNFVDCCEGLTGHNGVCRDFSGAAYWIDKSVCGVEVRARYFYGDRTWDEISTVCKGWRLPSPDEMKCILRNTGLYNDGTWFTKDETTLDETTFLSAKVMHLIKDNDIHISDYLLGTIHAKKKKKNKKYNHGIIYSSNIRCVRD